MSNRKKIVFVAVHIIRYTKDLLLQFPVHFQNLFLLFLAEKVNFLPHSVFDQSLSLQNFDNFFYIFRIQTLY
jgi:hypothetical protein